MAAVAAVAVEPRAEIEAASQLTRMLRQIGLPESVVVWLEPTIQLVLILIIWLILNRLVKLLIARFEHRLLSKADLQTESQFDARKRIDTLVGLLRQVVNIFLFVLLALVTLTQLGVQVGPLIAGAGIIGVAVGFGAQYLVRDIITGFFMVLENQIRVGDVVTINGIGGLVESLTLRTVVLRDGAGIMHVFPHGTVTTLANATRDWSAYIFNIAIAFKADPMQAMQAIRDVFIDLRQDEAIGPKIIADAEVWGIDKLDGTSVTIQGRIKTRPGMQADVSREFLRRLKILFEQRQIEMPSMAPTIQMLPPPVAKPVASD